MPLNGAATLSLRGARWPLREERLAPGSRGLSNEFKTRRVEMRVRRGVAALVFP